MSGVVGSSEDTNDLFENYRNNNNDMTITIVMFLLGLVILGLIPRLLA